MRITTRMTFHSCLDIRLGGLSSPFVDERVEDNPMILWSWLERSSMLLPPNPYGVYSRGYTWLANENDE